LSKTTFGQDQPRWLLRSRPACQSDDWGVNRLFLWVNLEEPTDNVAVLRPARAGPQTQKQESPFRGLRGFWLLSDRTSGSIREARRLAPQKPASYSRLAALYSLSISK
jgi:hypothetical protein